MTVSKNPEDQSKPVLHFYKYLPPTEDALKILTEGTLKYTKPMDFNDPFDCNPVYANIDQKKYFQKRPDMAKRFRQAHAVPAEKYLKARRQGIHKLNSSIKSGTFNADMMSSFGIVSLSKIPNDILMWSHYAKFHTGFIVEFTLQNTKELAPSPRDEKSLFPLDVTYSSKRPSIDLSDTGLKAESLEPLLTKSTHWSYEQECRHIDQIRGHGIWPYSVKGHLHAVIAGAKADASTLKLIQEAIQIASNVFGVDPKFYQAEMSKTKYEIFIPGHHSTNN